MLLLLVACYGQKMWEDEGRKDETIHDPASPSLSPCQDQNNDESIVIARALGLRYIILQHTTSEEEEIGGVE